VQSSCFFAKNGMEGKMDIKERKAKNTGWFKFLDPVKQIGGRLKRIIFWQWFGKMKIGVKLTVGFIIVAFIAGIIGFVGTFNINRISRDSHVIYTEDIAVLAPLHKISSDLLKMRINTVSHVLETKDKFGYQYRIKASQMSIDKELAEFKKSDNTEAE
jgi:hypothetical protein